MAKKDICPLGFKQRKYRGDDLLKHPLYKKCWKKKSLLLFETDSNSKLIGFMFMQHTAKLEGFEGHGFQLLGLHLNDDVSVEDYIENIASYLYSLYFNDMSVMWITQYIWWYKDADESHLLHKYIVKESGELIEYDDKYVFKIIHEHPEHPAYLRGKDALSYFYKVVEKAKQEHRILYEDYD